MMQYTNCVVKADKMQTVKLTLYKYKSWSCPVQNKRPPLLITVVYNQPEVCRLVMLTSLWHYWKKNLTGVQCSNYMEAKVCWAPSLVTMAPTLCGKSRVQRGPPSAPHFCAPCIKHQTLNSQVFLKSQRLLLEARFLAWNSPNSVWRPGSARTRWGS